MPKSDLNSDYLVTLDNGFFQSPVFTVAQERGLTIVKPKDIIETFR